MFIFRTFQCHFKRNRIINHMKCPFFAHTKRTKPLLSMFAEHLHPLPNRCRTSNVKFRSCLRLGNLPRQHSLHGFYPDFGIDSNALISGLQTFFSITIIGCNP